MKTRFHWAWLILLSAFITDFTYYSIRLGYGIIMPEMIKALEITKAQAGAIASSFYIAITIFVPIVGFLADRFDARKLLILFSLILGVGTFLMSKSTSFLQSCISFAIIGVGASAMWAPLVALIQRWFAPQRRGMAIGIFSSSCSLGYGVMGLLLPSLIARYDWQGSWLILSILAFSLVFLNALCLRNHPQKIGLEPWGEASNLSAEESPKKTTNRVRYRDLMKMRNLWLGAISYSFIAYTAYFTNLFIFTYASNELGIPFTQAASLASFIAFSGIFGALLLPTLSDFFGRKRCLVTVNILMGLSNLFVIFAGANWAMLCIAVCCFGFSYGAVWALYAAVAGDFSPIGATASVIGFWGFFAGIVLILGPPFGGYVADVAGTFVWSFLIAASIGITAGLIVTGLKRIEGSKA
jgi:sugar phosphate permease